MTDQLSGGVKAAEGSTRCASPGCFGQDLPTEREGQPLKPHRHAHIEDTVGRGWVSGTIWSGRVTNPGGGDGVPGVGVPGPTIPPRWRACRVGKRHALGNLRPRLPNMAPIVWPARCWLLHWPGLPWPFHGVALMMTGSAFWAPEARRVQSPLALSFPRRRRQQCIIATMLRALSRIVALAGGVTE